MSVIRNECIGYLQTAQGTKTGMGVLLSANRLLTAWHCYYSKSNPSPTSVSFWRTSSSGKTRIIESVEFENEDADIAVLQIKVEPEDSNIAYPKLLPVNDSDKGTKLWMCGFIDGGPNYSTDDPSIYEILKNINGIDRLYMREAKDTTEGFSGTPLCYGDYVVGIVSIEIKPKNPVKSTETIIAIPAQTIISIFNELSDYRACNTLGEIKAADVLYPIRDRSQTLYNRKMKDHPAYTTGINKGILGRLTPRLKTSDDQPIELESLPDWMLNHDQHFAQISGEGGMGKTTSLYTLWDQCANDPLKPIPIYIELQGINSSCDSNWLQAVIADFLNAPSYPIELLNDKKPVFPKRQFILLLDGMNEVATEKTNQARKEISYLVEHALNMDIIITTRAISPIINKQKPLLISLIELDLAQVKLYLKECDVYKGCEPDNLLKLLSNPMMLTVYCHTCGEQKNRERDWPFYFLDNVSDKTEVIYNYIESLLARRYRDMQIDNRQESSLIFSRWLFRQVLPIIGYEMVMKQKFSLINDDFTKIARGIIAALPEKKEYLQKWLQKTHPNTRNKVLTKNPPLMVDEDLFIDIYNWLLEDRTIMNCNDKGEWSFVHQDYRDFMAAAHILNECDATPDTQVPQILKERIYPLEILRFVGELTKQEQLYVHKGDLLRAAVNAMRDKRSDNSLAKALNNIVRTWNETNSGIQGEDFSRLDLHGVVTLPYIQGKGKRVTTKFDEARVERRNFFYSGHTGPVTTITYSPDGGQVVTGSRDKTARVWDAHSGALIHVLEGHTRDVTTASYSPDGSRIVTGSSDKTARVWDANSGMLIHVLEGHDDTVRTASYSPDGSRIVTGSGDNTARVWDANSGMLIHVLEGHRGRVYTASYSPDGSRIVTSSYDKFAYIWEIPGYNAKYENSKHKVLHPSNKLNHEYNLELEGCTFHNTEFDESFTEDDKRLLSLYSKV